MYVWHKHALVRDAAITLSSGGKSDELSACLRNMSMKSLFCMDVTSRGMGVICASRLAFWPWVTVTVSTVTGVVRTRTF
jgi:uncharacterized membrane protein